MMKVLPVLKNQEKVFAFWQKLQNLGVKVDQTNPDYILVLGGDGTFLGAVRKHYRLAKPFLGIGMGKANFLLNQNVCDAAQLIKEIENGEFDCFDLRLLEAEIKTRTGEFRGVAFNDVFVKAADPTGTIDLAIYTREHQTVKIKGDGLIVSTAQGSTAYNRTAGGTILPLLSHLWCLTGICTVQYLRVVIEPQEVLIENLGQEAVLVTDNEKFWGLEKAVVRPSQFQVQICFQKKQNFEQRRYQR